MRSGRMVTPALPVKAGPAVVVVVFAVTMLVIVEVGLVKGIVVLRMVEIVPLG